VAVEVRLGRRVMHDAESEFDAVFLGVGEAATVRWPTDEERSRLCMNHLEPVLVISHVDREADIVSVLGVTIAPRPYGIVAS
jgi:hypothetical protein